MLKVLRKRYLHMEKYMSSDICQLLLIWLVSINGMVKYIADMVEIFINHGGFRIGIKSCFCKQTLDFMRKLISMMLMCVFMSWKGLKIWKK